MTMVYSGGMMYEYSQEGNDYGIVTITGDSVTKSQEYNNFKAALAKYPPPTGNGGAASSSHSVACPSPNSAWTIDTEALPVMPSQAATYFQKGAGTGPGLTGAGSQTASNSGLSSANTTDGGSSSSSSDSAGVSLNVGKTSLLISAAVMCFTVFGTLTL